MANEIIRPSELPSRTGPVASEVVPSDNSSTVAGVSWLDGVNAAVPVSTQPEAEAGVNNSKRMTPLTTTQAIDYQVPPKISSAINALNLGSASQSSVGDFATAAQGAKADTALQPGNAALVPSGGTTGQVLVKDSDTDYDTGWVSSAAATAVSYAPQTLTSAQQTQARVNIDAMLNDPWAAQPIGVPIPLLDNLVGVAAPPTDKGYRYIKLTASDAYNTGVLTGQSVSGAAPLVVATAVISLSGSPINGSTVHLINTERRFLRAGEAGVLQTDAVQDHNHSMVRYAQYAVGTPAAQGVVGRSGDVAVNPYNTGAESRISDGAGGPSVRAADETRSKNIGATFFMRVL